MSISSEAKHPGKMGQRARHLRVAVVQMDHHPAFRDALFDPLFELKAETSSLLPTGTATAPSNIRPQFNELRRRVREAYVAQMRRRVEGIVDACKSLGVKLAVFPEYSIPPELLEPIAERSEDMILVAGSHFVERSTLRDRIYQRLGFDAVPDLAQSVSPVLHRGKLLALVPKLHPAKPEIGVIRPGDWAPVPLPAEVPGPLGVLLCLDYLVRSSESHLDSVARPLGECRLLAAPALTPPHSLPEFGAQTLRDARRERRPVLFANLARYGGSTVVVDEGREVESRLFPEHAGRLEAGEEGVIVADIDMGLDPAGSSTPYLLTPPIVPIAAASLVYGGVDRAYAAWTSDIRAMLDDTGTSDFDKLERIADFVSRKPPSTPPGDSARRRRIERLVQDIQDESDPERVEKLATEVLLPETVLPLRILRAALARGAADEVERWVSELGEGDFGPVANRLRKAWDEIDREVSSWSPSTQRAVNEVRASVRGRGKRPEPHVLLQILSTYERDFDASLEELQQHAAKRFREGQYDEARTQYQEMLRRAEEKLNAAGDAASEDLKRRVARCRLDVALATLNLQDVEQARALLAKIEPNNLRAHERLMLTEALALAGELAQAEAVLPGEEELSGDAHRARRREVRQTLDLFSGQLPEDLADSATVYLHAASLLLARGDLAGAAERALGTLGRATSHALTRAFAVQTITFSLRDTLFESPWNAVRVPVERRDVLVRTLEAEFAVLVGEALPAPVRQDLNRAEAVFRALSRDIDAYSDTARTPGTEVDDSSGTEPLWIAMRLARDGRVEEALRALPPDEHPWRGRFERAQMLAYGKVWDRAFEEVSALARDFPGRAPIEYLAAEVAVHGGRTEEALAYAERACALFPGKGYRLLLAGCRLGAGQAEEAWELLKDLDDERPLTLRTRGMVAEETGRLAEAERALRRYAAQRPDDARIRVRLAQLLFRLHRPHEAAAVAWAAFVDHGDRLDLAALHVCGSFQRLAGPLDAEQRRRILEIAARIRTRYPGNAAAEHLRLQLLLMLGELPKEAGPTDFDLLVKSGYVVKGMGLTSIEESLDQERSLRSMVARLARLGAILTSTVCDASGTPLALVVTRILERSRHAAGFLCPPVSLLDLPSALALDGATLLLSDLELLLLEVLDVFPALRDALGADGRVVFFRRTQERIHQDFAKLRIAASSGRLASVEALLRRLERLPAIDSDPSAPYDDEAAARRGGAAIISDEATEARCFSSRMFLSHLREQGCLDDAQHARLESMFPAETEAAHVSPELLSDRIVLSWDFVEALFREDALDAVFDALRGRLLLGPSVKLHFQSDRDRLSDGIRAEELAGRVQRRLNESWMREVPEPRVIGLPPLRDPEQAWGESLVLEPLREMLAYREAVLENPRWWRLSADFFGTNALGAPGFTDQLAWESTEAYLALMQRLRPAAERDLSLPALVRVLFADSSRADQHLLQLAELGFPDALGAEELLRLERRYRGLDKIEPKRVLGNQEWMARDPEHVGGDLARLRLAQTYASALLQAFSLDVPSRLVERSQAELSALCQALLTRQETIGQKAGSNALDQMLQFLTLGMLDKSRSAFRKADDENYVLERDWAGERLWHCIADWAGRDKARRAAYGRAIRDAWILLGRREPDGPAMVHAAALASACLGQEIPSTKDALLEMDAATTRPATDTLLDTETEAVAILSATWEVRPLEHLGIVLTPRGGGEPQRINLEQVLAHGAEELAAYPTALQDDRVVAFAVPVASSGSTLPVRAPIEALLLRSPETMKALAAKQLKLRQGVLDGALYECLEAVEKAPGDPRVLKAYAERAVSALFRAVRDDPTFLRMWPQSRDVTSEGERPTLDDLLRLLSEPDAPLPSSLHDALRSRLNGQWSNREDKARLFAMACEVPGTLVALPIPWWMENDSYERHTRYAIDRLDHPDESPIARIAGDIIFLRMAATRWPLVTLSEGEVDLREILPGRLERLLEKVMAPPEPDTLGAAEGALLRVCGEVVQRLAQPVVLPLREGLWLTYRLYQWLCLQLAHMSFDARREGIRRLVAQALPPGQSRDVLDPFGFDRDRFDHRLAAVLHALSSMEAVAEALKEQGSPEDLPAQRLASSPTLEDKLLQIARRAHVGPNLGSVLEWHAPGNVPDLALSALLGLNIGRFADLGAEARVLRFKALPDDPQALEQVDAYALRFASQVVCGAAAIAAHLTKAERALLEAKLRAMADGPTSRLFRWTTFVGFFVEGDDHLADDARQLTLEHVAHSFAPVEFGRLLLGLAARDLGRVEPTVEEMVAAAAAGGADAVELAMGALSRLLVHGPPAGQDLARALLLRLAERPPFQDDPRMREVIGFFGLRDTRS